ncbi:MAG: c-type cytochrome [Nitrospirae bacterium]|nr:c-type cytochrome [Nitrospirota bacterium]
MTGRKSFFDIIKWKLIGSAILGVVLWFASGALEFPTVFRIMFVLYAVLGFLVFVLLDLPPMPELSGGKAIGGLLIFYLLCSAVYTGAGVYLPQFDPEWEKGKIQKIIEAKKRAHPSITPQELNQQTQALTAKTDELMERLAKLEETMTGKSSAGEGPSAEELAKKKAAMAAGGIPSDPIAYGKEVYELYECYNCHKIGGKGSVKKRGPMLDNIGNLATVEQIKKKVYDPKFLMADGFEKEYNKGLMPKNYTELISDGELEALAAYLASLKNTSVNTPKPVLKQ